MSSGSAKRQSGPQVKVVKNFLDDESLEGEKIQIYGPAKGGKTYCYCEVIIKAIKKNPDVKIAIINTDGGFLKTFKVCCKDHNVNPYELQKNISLIPIHTIQEVEPSLEHPAVQEVFNNPGDWLIFDRANHPYSWAQEHFVKQCAESQNISVAEYISKTASDPKYFGKLEGAKWGYVKALDPFLNYVTRAKCNVIGIYEQFDVAVQDVHAQKDMKKHQKKGLKKEGRFLPEDTDLPASKVKQYRILQAWHEVGAKPGGHFNSSYEFSTIIYIKVGVKKRSFIILGDRGDFSLGKEVEYGIDFWDHFQAERTSGGVFNTQNSLANKKKDFAPPKIHTPPEVRKPKNNKRNKKTNKEDDDIEI